MTALACVHFWVLESPNGPTSPGVCQRCGATGSFSNWIDTTEPFSAINYRRRQARQKENSVGVSDEPDDLRSL